MAVVDARFLMRTQAAVHGIRVSLAAAFLFGWLVVIVLSRIGIPAVDPRDDFVARPLETLGTVALCLPAGLLAAALRDHGSWLTTTSPRSMAARRGGWLAATAGFGLIGAAIWIATLPVDVPSSHTCLVWLVLSGLATLTAVFLRWDLAVLGPFATVAVFSLGRLIPFDDNVFYNIDRTGTLAIVAVLTWLTASTAYIRHGARGD